MRLQEYLLTEGRTKAINKEEAKNILHTECKQAIKFYEDGNVYINRRIDDFNGLFGVIYPKKGGRGRKSRNTNNLYTLVINNSPEWSNFPRREIICSTNTIQRDYMVFPFDGAKIGVCIDFDIWKSFYILNNLNFSPVFFNDAIEEVLDMENKKFPLSYSKLKTVTSSINIDDIDWYRVSKEWFDEIERIIQPSHKTLFDLIMHVYGDPKINGFQLKKIGDKLPTGKEIWTDSPCMFVDKSMIDMVLY
jgi:hypothetical protein